MSGAVSKKTIWWSAVAVLAVLCLLSVILATSCNKQIFDFKLRFHTAIVKWPDGSVKEIKVQYWNDYQNSEQIKIIDNNGKTYLMHSVNVILVGD